MCIEFSNRSHGPNTQRGLKARARLLRVCSMMHRAVEHLQGLLRVVECKMVSDRTAVQLRAEVGCGRCGGLHRVGEGQWGCSSPGGECQVQGTERAESTTGVSTLHATHAPVTGQAAPEQPKSLE